MYLRFLKRLLLETDKRLLWKAAYLAGYKGIRSVQRHKWRLKRGTFFPPFLYISVINSCNLRCTGCWVDVTAKQRKIDVDAMDRMLSEAKAMGNAVFGILGGEPFMHRELLEIFARHPDAFFQVFTNGHFITAEVAGELRRLGNVSPLISVEGNEIVSDERRGGSGVYSATLEGLRHCLDARLFTGVCTSLCQTNLELLSEAWVDRLIEMGVFYCWYHIYRAVGPEAAPELCLMAEQQRSVRRFVVEMRAKKPIIMIDAYHDAHGEALCPAVTGFTHHIGPGGDIEPCPVIQLAVDSIHDERPLREVFNESEFLRDFRGEVAQVTRGCVALERPDLLQALARRHGARDTTSRQTVMAELAATKPHRSQYHPGEAIPEKSLAYRLAKRLWFHDYGVYERSFDERSWRDPAAGGTIKDAVGTASPDS